MAISTGDSVTIAYTGRLDDGTVFDTTDESVAEEAGLREEQPERDFGPLTVEVGAGNLIEGMEEGLLGLEEGDSETITVPPQEAYGEAEGDSVREFDPEEFEKMVGQNPEEGLQVRAQGGAVGTVVDVSEDTVHVDFEHPLAGETLTFEIDVLAVE
ncbi:FKBP-type peptidyl-prolyl cis-trans isomerase [Haloplanus halophilus]|uniref:FKBP-type peptidyl-prolyl cis-trans isomerase n=1 Tax=Haloplanus halophilus TaxID=2949993 RepID=UPI00203E31A2|nr:FKBP-type peptidyl-prolyl cis-trans isomerase [Haloplanus sp. GDY1]